MTPDPQQGCTPGDCRDRKLTGPDGRYLEIGINSWTIVDLPDWSHGPRGSPEALFSRLRDAGYRHLQIEDHDPLLQPALDAGFEVAGAARVDRPEQVASLARRRADQGIRVTTLHVGTGFETEADACKLIESILEASSRYDLCLWPETHRATLTQDAWRTLQLIERFPELRFNADLSHWYTGLEFVYGDFAAKLQMLEPLFARVRYMHGRIGDSGSIQVPLTPGRGPARLGRHIDDFQMMWTRCFAAFLRRSEPGERVVFCAELLPHRATLDGTIVELNYASVVEEGGVRNEISDRWRDAEELNRIAREAYSSAVRSLTP